MFDEKTYIEREGKLKDGYIRAAAMTPKIKVADCEYNIENIKSLMSEAHKKDTAIAVFPEMCITGYTCNDLFLHDRLLNAAIQGLVDIKKYSETTPGMISFVGLPYEMNGKLYNVVAGIMNGCILGMVPKMYLPNYGEFYERRQFTPGFNECVYVDVDGEEVPFGSELLFTFNNNRKVKIGVEICEDADLTQKMRTKGKAYLVPQYTAIHAWHRAAHRSLKPFLWQLRSLLRYFSKWGFAW